MCVWGCPSQRGSSRRRPCPRRVVRCSQVGLAAEGWLQPWKDALFWPPCFLKDAALCGRMDDCLVKTLLGQVLLTPSFDACPHARLIAFAAMPFFWRKKKRFLQTSSSASLSRDTANSKRTRCTEPPVLSPNKHSSAAGCVLLLLWMVGLSVSQKEAPERLRVNSSFLRGAFFTPWEIWEFSPWRCRSSLEESRDLNLLAPQEFS